MSKLLYGKRWPEDFPFRFYIGDHVVAPTPALPHLLAKMDGRDMVRQLADAGVDAIYMYACNSITWLYPTEIKPGYMHPSLKGRDVFGEVADECQKRRIPFIGAYGFPNSYIISAGPREWRHYYPDAVPECGRAQCWNSGYGDLFKRQIEEISRRYPMAGIFIDMMDHPGLVCCEGCARRFKDATGAWPPRVEDYQSLLYKVFKLWTYQDAARYLCELRQILRTHQPDATFIQNFHVLNCEDLYETADANDYLYTDPGSGFGYVGEGAVRLNALMAIFRSISRGKPPFEILLDQINHGLLSVLPAEPYQAVMSMISAQGAAVGPGTLVDQHGRMNAAAVGLTKQAAAFSKARRPWRAAGEPVRFAGLYLSQESKLFYGAGDAQRYLDEFHGAWLMLQREHWPVDVLTRRDLGRLGEYPVIFLPNAVCMSDGEIEALRRYVRDGGTLVASYRASLSNEWNEPRSDFGLSDVFGVSFSGQKIEPKTRHQLLLMPLPDGLYATEPWENRNISLSQTALICSLKDGAQAPINIHDRYHASAEIPDLYGPHAYMRETPVGPAVVENRYGKGRSVYFAGKIFSAYLFTGIPSLRKLATRWILADLVKTRLFISLDAPDSVDLNAYVQPDRNRLLVHLVNYQSAPGRLHLPAPEIPDTEHILPVCDLALSLAFGGDEVTGAVLQPAGENLKITRRDGKTVIAIPRVHIYEIVEIALKPGACPRYPDSNRVFAWPRHDLKAKVRQWLTAHPAHYDPNDMGTLSFEKWRLPEEFLTNWKVVGPFACLPGQGLQTVFEPEGNPSPAAVYADRDGAPLRWLESSGLRRHRTGFVEMCGEIGNQPNTVGYALTFLRSDKVQRMRFHIGTDDPCRVWVNGVECYTDEGSKQRRLGPDQASFEADLKTGWNTVLVKKVNLGHGLGFYLRLDDAGRDIESASRPDADARA